MSQRPEEESVFIKEIVEKAPSSVSAKTRKPLHKAGTPGHAEAKRAAIELHRAYRHGPEAMELWIQAHPSQAEKRFNCFPGQSRYLPVNCDGYLRAFLDSSSHPSRSGNESDHRPTVD